MGGGKFVTEFKTFIAMKKLLFAFICTAFALSCGQSQEPVEVLFINLTTEEQELFSNEIGLRDKLDLGDYSSQSIHIVDTYSYVVSEVNDTLTVTNIDLALASTVVNSCRDQIPSITDEVVNNIKNMPLNKCQLGDDWSYEVMHYDLGEDFTIIYVLRNDGMSFTSLPMARAYIENQVNNFKSAPALANASEDELRAIVFITDIAAHKYPFFAGRNYTLSNGKTVRTHCKVYPDNSAN